MLIISNWEDTYVNKNIIKFLLFCNKNKIKVYIYCDEGVDKAKTNSVKFVSKFFLQKKNIRYYNIVGLVKQFFTLNDIIRSNKISAVISYTGYRENLFLSLIKVFFQFTLVIKNDSSPLLEGSIKNLFKIIQRYLWIYIPFKSSDLVISESDSVFKNTINICNDLNNHFLYKNGISYSNLNKMKKEFRFEKSFSNNQYILFTGRLSWLKGLDRIVEIFTKIVEMGCNYNLIIVGEDCEDGSVQYCKDYLQSHGILDRVEWVPYQSGKDLYRYYYFASIFVIPSKDEGLPNRLIEAMFFNNAIVSFDVGQVKSLVNNSCGFMHDQNDMSGFSESLLLLTNNGSMCNKMGTNSYHVVMDGFNDDKIFPKLYKIIFKI